MTDKTMCCNKCEKSAKRTLKWRNKAGFLCEKCFNETSDGLNRENMLHQSANNRWSPRMTETKKRWMASHRKNPDGTVTPRRGL